MVLRPGPKHRLHIDYLPMNYDRPRPGQPRVHLQRAALSGRLPVATTAQFKTWRFGYEYDFLYKPRGFLGVVLDVKVTDVNVGLNSPIGDEFAKALAPIPTIGAAGRFYPPRTSRSTASSATFACPRACRTTTRAATSTGTSTRPSTPARTVQAGQKSTSSTRCATIPAR